ncbi:folate-binding protein YgfZ [Glutamicibacter sp. BW77]|uniref:CAF17-like 4Fe-4S cluster assembly/insertion protein YgfZ n=1 Tax=Glutamicibacter sp. BW77 TaxID=2024402 RepID=UPI000BB85C7B|nr:folate-binding protein YgfZ [Glutamicibacter sp. BW77]PCC32556.1 folate-binding protein YgfZ [Glutamicibacter sp. BW77]
MSENSYRSVLLDRQSAIAGTGADAGVASHYGAPTREARDLFAGKAIADLSHLDVLELRGEDRQSWLNTLSSQSITNLKPGESSQALLLSVQGRIEHEMKVLIDTDRVLLITELGRAEPLREFLNSMRFMLRVEITNLSETHGVLGAVREIPTCNDLVWRNPWPQVNAGGWAYSREDHPGLERPWFLRIVELDRLAQAVGEEQLAGTMAVESLRIAAWEPRFGFENDDKTIPHELDWLRTAVHLDKGCYKGQETVARVHNIGHPPRRLVFLHLDGSMHTLPAEGSEIKLGERTVGKLTSTSLHFEAGPIALGVIKRNVDPEAVLTVVDGESNYPASQEVIVAPDAGQTAGRFTGFLRTPPSK